MVPWMEDGKSGGEGGDWGEEIKVVKLGDEKNDVVGNVL